MGSGGFFIIYLFGLFAIYIQQVQVKHKQAILDIPYIINSLFSVVDPHSQSSVSYQPVSFPLNLI